MACRNILLNVLGNESSLSKYIINKIAFNPPSTDTYSIKISDTVYSHSSLSKSKPIFTQFGKCEMEVDFISTKFPFFPSLFTFLTIKSYLLYKPQTQSHICLLHITNKAAMSSTKRFTLIYSHGNTSDLGDNLPFLTTLSNVLKCDVISYDYSGFGCSTGKPSEEAINSDLNRVIDFTLNDLKYKIDNIILFGYSIGSICTINSAIESEYSNIAGIVLLSPLVYGLNKYFSEEKEKNEKIDVIKDAIEQTNYYKISHIEKPILLIHGKEDEIVPYNHSIQLSKRIQQLSQWFPKEGNHCNIPYEMRYKFYSKFHNFIEHIKTTSIIAESQYDSKNQKEKVVKVDTIKNYINKEDPNDKVNESIQMFINGDEDTTETTTNMTSQRVSQGNNAFSYYGSIKPNFNGLFGANHYNDDDDY